MSSFTNDLIPGEKVLAISKKNWTIFISKRNILGIFLSLLALILSPILSLVILVGFITPTILEFINTELVLTNLRLRGKQGAFKIRTLENKASYFKGNVRTRSNMVLTSLGSDDIIVESLGVSPFIFTHMKNAKNISNALYSLDSSQGVQEVQVINKI